MPSEITEQLTKYYRIRYRSSLLLISLLIFSELIILKMALSQQEETHQAVNISGRQRMLSQRLNMLSSNLINATSREEFNSVSA